MQNWNSRRIIVKSQTRAISREELRFFSEPNRKQDELRNQVQDGKKNYVEVQSRANIANIFKKEASSQPTINNAFKKKLKEDTDLQVSTYF